MSPRAQVLGNLPKERPDVSTSPTYIFLFVVCIPFLSNYLFDILQLFTNVQTSNLVIITSNRLRAMVSVTSLYNAVSIRFFATGCSFMFLIARIRSIVISSIMLLIVIMKYIGRIFTASSHSHINRTNVRRCQMHDTKAKLLSLMRQDEHRDSY